jgi:hypothetical protein
MRYSQIQFFQGGVYMPNTFKALATIAVWTLWICAWIAFLFPFILGGIARGYLWNLSATPPDGYWISYAIAIGSSVGAGFWMLVRRKLEG